ncbi:MAG: sulfite exporter TauE/SafE family protein [Candidatus Binataceae bacterium]
MFGHSSGLAVLFVVALFAAAVNGALGYGFSTLTVPIALLFFSNKILSPALVLVEVAINAFVVAHNRASLAAIRTRALAIIVGLVPGILIGSYLLTTTHPGWLKLCTYAAILPLILLQASGFRRPIRAEHAAGVPLGLGVGILYATTTISGPPLAVMLKNQGIDQDEFRAALGTIRGVEAVLTAIVFAFLGLYTSASVQLVVPIAPAVLIGLPLGAFLARFVNGETFRRVCMSFDAWVVGFGLARSLLGLKLLPAMGAYGIWAAVILIDLYLLHQYFVAGRFRPRPAGPAFPADAGGEASAG